MKPNTDYFDSLVSKTLEGSINTKDFEVLRSMLMQMRIFSVATFLSSETVFDALGGKFDA